MSRVLTEAELAGLAKCLGQDEAEVIAQYREFAAVTGVDLARRPDVAVMTEQAPGKRPKFWLVDEELDARFNVEKRLADAVAAKNFDAIRNLLKEGRCSINDVRRRMIDGPVLDCFGAEEAPRNDKVGAAGRRRLCGALVEEHYRRRGNWFVKLLRALGLAP